MAYKLNEQRITPGGLDLRVPGDQVAEGECLDLTDWFAGAVGKLEQGLSPVRLNDATIVTGQYGLLQVSAAGANRVYYSDGTVLRQIGRGAQDDVLNPSAHYDTWVPGMISYQGYAWIMNRAYQHRDNGTTFSVWTIAAPAAAPTLSDLGTGGNGAKLHLYEDTYRVTWVTPGLGESNPSGPALLTPAVNLSSTRISIAALTPPAGVTAWNVYRQVPPYGGGNQDATTTPYLVNPDPIPIGTTHYDDTGSTFDSQDDTSLLRLGTILEADHDAPPAARIMANQIYNGRIVVANSADHPNRIWYTPPLQPAFFRGSADAYGGDWVDIGTDSGDEIRAITVRPGFLAIYRAKSIWVHIGDLGDTSADIRPVVPEMGITGANAVVSTSAADYFVSSDGVYAFNNDHGQKASFKVDPIWRGLSVENFAILNRSRMDVCAIGHRQGRIWVTYADSSGVPVVSLILDIASGRWFAGSAGYTAFLDIGTGLLAASGSTTAGGVFTLESAYGTAAALAFQSQYHDCGLPDRLKTWADLVLSHNTHNQILSIVCRLNKNQGTYDSFTLDTTIQSGATSTPAPAVKSIVPLVYPAAYGVTALRGLPIKSFSLSIRITGTGNAGTQPVVIDSPMLLHYYVEARKARAFDSGPTDHGLGGVGLIDQVEIDCDTSDGAATLAISSDVPGGVMANRTSGTLAVAQTSGRQVLRLVLAARINGRLFRHQMATTTGFQIYGYRVRLLPIGVYADGAQSDVWYTLPLALGEQGQG